MAFTDHAACEHDVSRRDTTHLKTSFLEQLPLGIQLGSRSFVHRALRLRVAESRADCRLAADIIRRRHLLRRWPCPPETLMLSFLSSLDGVTPGPAGAAGIVTVALLPNNYSIRRALGLEQYEVLTLCRLWRADDLGPALFPDLTPETLRRVIRGERSHGPLRDLATEWQHRKCHPDRLRAAPRLLAIYADPAFGHDCRTYLGAGATACGESESGKLLFAWALDPTLKSALAEYGTLTARAVH